jgi:hypothetical protein
MTGNQTKILISLVLGLVFILSGYAVYRYLSNDSTDSTTSTSEPSNAFPESGSINPSSGGTSEGVGGGQNGGQTTRPVGSTNNENGAPGTTIDELTLKIVSEKPIAGGVFIEREDPESPIKAKKLYVRYMERESGHIYELAFNENIPKKISNTTITRIHDSSFNNTNNTIFLRRLDEDNNVQNIYAILQEKAPTTSPAALIEAVVGKLSQSLLSAGIKEFAVSPNRNKIFYLTEFGEDYVGTTEDFSSKLGVNKKQVFSSPLREWLIQWPKDDTLFFNTKPSVSVPGFLFSQNLNKTGFTKILGDINGLTSNVSPDGKRLIYSESIEGGLKTYIYNLETRRGSVWSLATMPSEKCLWGGIGQDILYCAVPSPLPPAEYPDAWYQGIISFDDELWRVDTKTGNAELLVDRATLDRSGGVDAINLVLSPREEYLLFTNKKDSSLWQIKIK